MRQIFSQAIGSIALNIKNLFSTLFSKKAGVAIAALVLLFVGTGCNPPAPNVVGNSGDYTERKGQQTELYDGVQPATGKMNQHNDDFRYDEGATKGKADRMIRQADRNLDKTKTPKDALNEFKNANPGGNIRKNTEAAKNTLDKVTSDVSEGTKRGTENLKANAKKAQENIKGFGNDAAEQAQQAGENALKTTQRAVDSATDRT
ncbi:MAG: hypothetical protein KME11_10950 [Timaviella obliquedivisa GSE-PSE-MK23-08B]|jgi:hypothetical protein|nr:hypothetical protein [Timaviella obliquedivisa GSE-PSE-MK23-08B]